MGTKVGIWEGLYSAVADSLWDLSGYLLVRTTAPYTSGDVSIAVESTDRFPDSGRIAFGKHVALYSSKTNTSFDGLTDYYTGDPGVEVDLAPMAVVQDLSRTGSQLDDLRASFLLPTAEGEELDILANNYGINRIRGLDDDTFRALLEVWIYLEAGTVYGCEQILDILWGPSGYELYEDFPTYPNTVFVSIPLGLSSDYRGKAFLHGGEEQPRTSPTTVDTTYDPVVVAGIWDVTDPDRAGTNYALREITTGSTTAGVSTRELISDSGAGFLLADEGKSLILEQPSGTVEHWKVEEFIDTMTLRLSGRMEIDGTLYEATPNILSTPVGWFETWMVGHRILITSGTPENAGSYVILSVPSPYSVVLSGASFLTETNVTWQLRPNFGTESPVSILINRATVSGNTITVPAGPLPTTVLVDYTTIPSAELMTFEGQDGNDAYPWYFWDSSDVTRQIMDLITVAGVRVLIEQE